MKQYQGLRNLAFKLHKLFHRVQDGKNPKHKDFDYYTSGFAYFDKRLDEIEDKIKASNVELFNKIIDLEDKFNTLDKSIKEVSKFNKYIWQNLNEKDHEYQEGEDLISEDGTSFILTSREASISNSVLHRRSDVGSKK